MDTEIEPVDTDVVVVGAGIGGLQTAHRLAVGGVAVTVLEARDRVGGRLLSTATDTGRIDLGATWFWPNEPRVSQLVRELDLDSFSQYRAGDMVVQAETTRRAPNQLDVPSRRLSEGFQSLTEALADRLPSEALVLNTAAVSVESDGRRLAVATNAGLFRADHVVLALPPALAMTSIEFGAPLDSHVAEVARRTPVWMGSTTKIVATFDRPFWRDAGLAGSAFSYRGPMRELHDMSGPNGSPAALFGFAMAAAHEPAPDADAVVVQLTELFGSDAAAPTSIHIMDWRREPFTVPPSALGLTDYRTYGHAAFQQPALDGRLHWAATETSPAMPGHVEGALVAADRTVSAIASSIHRRTP